MNAFSHKCLMIRCNQNHRLPLTCLWLGLITKVDSLSLAPVLKIYVRYEVIFEKNGKEVVDCVLGMISSSWSKLFTWLHTIHIYYTHKIMVHRPRELLVILQGFSFKSFLTSSLANNLGTHQCGLQVRCHMVNTTTLTQEPTSGGNS